MVGGGDDAKSNASSWYLRLSSIKRCYSRLKTVVENLPLQVKLHKYTTPNLQNHRKFKILSETKEENTIQT
jgi:hypothetical protein